MPMFMQSTQEYAKITKSLGYSGGERCLRNVVPDQTLNFNQVGVCLIEVLVQFCKSISVL